MAQTAKTTRKRSTKSTKSTNSRARSNGSSGRTRKPASTGAKRANSTNSRSTSRSSTISEVASKAKTPALAAGAGLAGLAGGLALAHRTGRKRVLGVPMPNGGAARTVSKNLAEAARNVGSFGEGMGSLAAEVRQVRESVATAEESKRSPIEIVLQGLTRRH